MTNPPDQQAREHSFGIADQGGLRQRFVSGVSWNLAGTALTQGSVFAANILIANRLGPESFGEFSLLQNTALTLSAIAQVATGATATRYVARYRTTDPARAGRILGLCSAFTLLTGLTASLLLLLFSDWVSASAMNSPQLSSGLKIMALYLLFSAMSGYQTGALAGLEGYQRIAQLGALHALVHIAVVAIGVWLYGMPGALWSLVASILTRWALHHQAIRVEAKRFGIHIAYVMQKEERGVLLRFSLPAALGGLTTMPALWVANTFLAQQPSGFSQFGLFVAALNLKTIVLFIPSMVSNVGAVLVHSHSGANDRTRFRRAYFLNLYASLVAFSSAAIAALVFSDPLLSLFGEGFKNAKPLVHVLLVAALIETVTLPMYQLVYSLEKMWWSLFAIALPRDLVFLASALLLIPEIAAPGLAWAHVLGSSTALCSVFYFVRRNRGHLRHEDKICDTHD